MAKEVKYLKQVAAHLEKKYGSQKAQAIMAKALERYREIVDENNDEPRAYYMHTRQRIYPAIAVFDAMTSEGIARDEAADFLNEYYRWRARGVAPKIKALFKILGLYRIAPKFFFSMTQKSFGPQMGFRSENKHLDKHGMRFDMVVCPYHDKCALYGCPEIVSGFCDADDICYSAMPQAMRSRSRAPMGRRRECG